MSKFFLVCCLVLAGFFGRVAATEFSPRITVGLNILEFVGFNGALWGMGLHKELTYLPFHLNANVGLSNKWSLSAGIVYRFENYFKAPKDHMWRNYHEVFLMAGPRFSPSASGLEGLYLSLRAGIGLGVNAARTYTAVTFVAQPEVGYSFFMSDWFYLALGGGLLVNVPIYDKLGYEDLTIVGYLVHRFIPVGNVTIGFGF